MSSERDRGGPTQEQLGDGASTGLDSDADVRALAAELNAAIAVNGTVERSVKEKRYLKTSLRHHGTPVPVTRRLVKDLLKRHPNLTRSQVLVMVEELWTSGVHEARTAVVELLALRSACLGPDDLQLLERLLREARTWALVDELAPRVVGPLRSRHPEVEATLDAWAADADFWLRRAALLTYLQPLRRGEDVFERFTQLADGMLEDREFFIRKAIGWALRERGKCAPDEVYAWLVPRLKRTSGLTLREASKYLRPEQAASLRATPSASA